MAKKKRVNTLIRLVLIGFSSLVVVLPLYFVVLNSFKPYREIAANIAAWPRPLKNPQCVLR